MATLSFHLRFESTVSSRRHPKNKGRFTCGLASQVAWHRVENGPKFESGKKQLAER